MPDVDGVGTRVDEPVPFRSCVRRSRFRTVLARTVITSFPRSVPIAIGLQAVLSEGILPDRVDYLGRVKPPLVEVSDSIGVDQITRLLCASKVPGSEGGISSGLGTDPVRHRKDDREKKVSDVKRKRTPQRTGVRTRGAALGDF